MEKMKTYFVIPAVASLALFAAAASPVLAASVTRDAAVVTSTNGSLSAQPLQRFAQGANTHSYEMRDGAARIFLAGHYDGSK
jgi:hypothetical protein